MFFESFPGIFRAGWNVYTMFGEIATNPSVEPKAKKGYFVHLVSLLRPFFILRFRIFLPEAVALRFRYPCFLFPFRFVGVFNPFFIGENFSIDCLCVNHKNVAKKIYCGIIISTLRTLVNKL